MYCILPERAAAFRQALKDKTIDLTDLLDPKMTSEERTAIFRDYTGTDAEAKQLNTQFEEKLVLKNRLLGIKNLFSKAAGIGKYSDSSLEESAKAASDYKAKQTERIFSPKENEAFLNDLVDKKMGIHIDRETAATVFKLQGEVNKLREAMENGGDRMDYGRAKVAMDNYLNSIESSETPGMLEQLKHPGALVSELAATAKGLKASLDDSAIFRQGWKTMFTNPVVWAKNAGQSFVDLAQQFGGKEVMDEVQAEIQSRPTYDLMQEAGLDVGTTEEEFPTHLVEKLPIIGRAYKASEAAYTGFVYRTRADIFDKYLKTAETAGVDISDKEQLESIGKLVNSLTGRGYLGKTGERAASVVNNLFFSPRFLKSQIDVLSAHQFQKGVTPFVRKQAATNLLKIIAGTGTILAIANAIMPGSVELDPRSANFGKIKIGKTTFDVSGGMGSVLTLGARIATLSSKSSITNKVTKLNSGKFGSQTGLDVFENFAEGKLSPLAGIVRDILQGEDYNYNKPTFPGEVSNLLTPLPITNAVQSYQNPKGAGALISVIADALGISVNNINPPKKK